MNPLVPPTVAQREPALIIGLVTTAVASVLVLLAAFGVDLTPAQQVAVIGVIAGVGPLVAVIITRSKVTPSATVVESVSSEGERIAGPASPLPTGSVIPTPPVESTLDALIGLAANQGVSLSSATTDEDAVASLIAYKAPRTRKPVV